MPVPRQSIRLNHEIRRLAFPALLTLAADPLVSLIDSAFVGRIGTNALAALGVNAAIFSIAFVAFNFLSYGTTPVVAEAFGAGDEAKIRRGVTQAIVLAVGLGVVSMVMLLVGRDTWLAILQTPAEVADDARTYLSIRAFAAPAVLIIMAANGAFRGKQDTVSPLRVTLVLNVINLVGDAVLIFGLGLGIAGAAVATTIAQWVGALWFLRLLAADWVGFRAINRDELRVFVAAGWAIVVRTGALLAALTVATAMAGRAGSNALAAHHVLMQIWLLLTLLLDSLAVAGQAMVGRFIGASEPDRADAAVRTLALWGVGTGVVLGGLILASGALLGPVFGLSDEVAALAIAIIPFVAALQPLGGLLFVGDGVFLGASRFRFLAVTTVGAALAAALVFWLMADRGDLLGVWLGIAALLIGRLVPQVVSYARRGTVVGQSG